jgi:hypothetical membrane protein
MSPMPSRHHRRTLMIIRAAVFPVAQTITATAWSHPEHSSRQDAISDLGNTDNQQLKGSFSQWN